MAIPMPTLNESEIFKLFDFLRHPIVHTLSNTVHWVAKKKVKIFSNKYGIIYQWKYSMNFVTLFHANPLCEDYCQ